MVATIIALIALFILALRSIGEEVKIEIPCPEQADREEYCYTAFVEQAFLPQNREWLARHGHDWFCQKAEVQEARDEISHEGWMARLDLQNNLLAWAMFEHGVYDADDVIEKVY